MREFTALLLSALIASGCGSTTVTRDTLTYQQEIQWFTKTLGESEKALTRLLGAHCFCVGGEKGLHWTTAECSLAAETAVVIESRADWHGRMSLFLAGLGEDPGEPSTIPHRSNLCPTAIPKGKGE